MGFNIPYLFISLFIVGNPRLIMHRSSRGTTHNQLWVSDDVNYWAITCFFYCKNVLCKQIIFAKFATSRKNSKYWSWYMDINVWICLAFIVYWKQLMYCMYDFWKTWSFYKDMIDIFCHQMPRVTYQGTIITNLTWCLFAALTS